MIFYSILFLALFFVLSVLNSRKTSAKSHNAHLEFLDTRQKKPNLTAFIFVTVLSIIAAFRYQVGSDYNLYVYWYQRIVPTSLNETIAINPQSFLFATFQFLLRQFSSSSILFFLVTSLLTLIPYVWAVKRISKFQIKSFFMFCTLGFFFLSLNAVRQSISVSFLILAFSFQKESKKVFYILSIFASFIHSSAVIAFFVLWLSQKIKWNKLTISGIILSSAPLHLLIRIPQVIDFIGKVDERFVSHLRSSQAGIGTTLNIMYLSVVFFILAANVKNEEDKKHLMCVLFGLCFFSLALSSYILGRLVPYFTIYLTIVIPNILTGSKSKNYLGTFVSFSTIVYFFMYGLNYDEVVPYQFWLG
jgi:hypothetical protein